MSSRLYIPDMRFLPEIAYLNLRIGPIAQTQQAGYNVRNPFSLRHLRHPAPLRCAGHTCAARSAGGCARSAGETGF